MYREGQAKLFSEVSAKAENQKIQVGTPEVQTRYKENIFNQKDDQTVQKRG